MIETTTARAIRTNHANGIQAENKKVQSFRPQQFQGDNCNPCHDGCNVTEKQLQASKDQTETVAQTDKLTIDPTDNSNQQSSGMEKASGGNCPGSSLIANILQQLIGALEATNTGNTVNTER